MCVCVRVVRFFFTSVIIRNREESSMRVSQAWVRYFSKSFCLNVSVKRVVGTNRQTTCLFMVPITLAAYFASIGCRGIRLIGVVVRNVLSLFLRECMGRDSLRRVRCFFW